MSLPGDLGSSLKVTIVNDSVKRNVMQEMRKNNKTSSESLFKYLLAKDETSE